jgi:hypothetical protein
MRLLVELQALDTSILEKNSLISRLPKQLSAKEGPLKEAKAKLDERRRQRDALTKKRKSRETDVEDMNQKIAKAKARTSDIKTNVAYQAHLKEIESFEKERYRMEDEILAMMEEMEVSEKTIKEEEKNVKAEEERLAALGKEVEGQVEEAKKELAEVRKKRTELAGRVEAETYELYMKVLQKHQGLAVAEARGEICSGCNMSIMPQLFVEIKRGEEIFQCPQCDRLLYYKEEEAPEEKPVEKTAG